MKRISFFMILFLITSILITTQIVGFYASANWSPIYANIDISPQSVGATPPTINFLSPQDNKTCGSNLTLHCNINLGTVTQENVSFSIENLYYQADWENQQTKVIRLQLNKGGLNWDTIITGTVNSIFTEFSTNLTAPTTGKHSITFWAVEKGSYEVDMGKQFPSERINVYTFHINSSKTVSFTVDDNSSPQNSVPSIENQTYNASSFPLELWSFTFPNATDTTVAIEWSKPVVAEGVVYIRELDIHTISDPNYHDHFGFGPPQRTILTLYALNAATGAKLWNYTTTNLDYGLPNPIVANGVVYMATSDDKSNVYALKALTGALLWNHAADIPDYTTLSFVNNKIFFAGIDIGNNGIFNMYVCALNASNGEELWRHNIGQGDLPFPVVADSAVYFGANKIFYALNIDNGEVIWNQSIGPNIVASPTVTNGVIYLSSNNYEGNSNVYALSVVDGHKLWTKPISNESLTAPTVNNGVVYFGSGNYCYALNAANGANMWNYQTNDSLVAFPNMDSPIVSDEVIYFRSGDSIYALDATNGEKLWSHTTTHTAAPIVVKDTLYFAAGNKFYALRLPTDPAPANPTVMPTQTEAPETWGREPLHNQWPLVLAIIAIAVVLVVLGVMKKMQMKKPGLPLN
jgi:outer membrane protein assembly factor BamB